MQAQCKSKRDGQLKPVDVNYAALHVAVRGNVPMSGAEARRRLLAGEVLETAEAHFFVAENDRGLSPV